MNSRSDQFERHCHLRIKLEDAIELLGPGDFVLSQAPGKAADATQMLCFRKERFTSLQRRFAQCPLDGYAGNVGNLRDEILLNLSKISEGGVNFKTIARIWAFLLFNRVCYRSYRGSRKDQDTHVAARFLSHGDG